MRTATATDFNFETALEQLNLRVQQLEKGQLPLEKALQTFEEGITLVRQCQQMLTQAEQKVQILMQQQGQSELVSFQHTVITSNDNPE